MVAEPVRAIRCPCGFEVRSRAVDEVIRAARRHVEEVHGQELSDEQARTLIEVVP